MPGEDRTYLYCSNPLCGYRRIARLELGVDAVYAAPADAKETGGSCPYCEGPLVLACPGCGRTATSRPLLFCPACGANLVGKERETRCAWCGGSMRTTSAFQGDVPCCSERCLRNYLLRNVKTCDQCGMRFTAAGINGASFIDVALQGQENRKYDFCSIGCLEKYAAEHGACFVAP
ncbi:hypothetical protein [Desulfolutivibrio sulfoxidireducens]|uniref:hypothetical protein n=1 Tax=Desulfolutivibrio sulfoxidireducens TaxID=2773299 RepID=UPI00159DE431|nr:hypothetical protein [Desulfolutivibrio sulfoxidireducens]QLA15378.1 hypothetical protein GD605_04085 [Desulfolutivibrio sulfoxidireducens]